MHNLDAFLVIAALDPVSAVRIFFVEPCMAQSRDDEISEIVQVGLLW